MTDTKEIASRLKDHVSKVGPGTPFHLTDAHEIGEGVWQGDLGIEIVSGVPNGYKLVKATDKDRQLVPEGGGPGSNHRIQSLDGVKLYRPANWGTGPADLRGPCIVFERPNAIVHEPGHDHPHATVFIDGPMAVLCRYQRNLNVEQRAMRAAD